MMLDKKYVQEIYKIVTEKPLGTVPEIIDFENDGTVVVLDYGDGRTVKKLTCEGIIDGTKWIPLHKDFKKPAPGFEQHSSGAGLLEGRTGYLKSTEGPNDIIGVFDVNGTEFKALLKDPQATGIIVGKGTFRESRNPWVLEPWEEKVYGGQGVWFGPYLFSEDYKLATYCDKQMTLNLVMSYGGNVPKDAGISSETATGYLIVDRFMSVVTIQEKEFEGAYSYIGEEELPYDEDDVCSEIYGLPEQFTFDLNPAMSQENTVFSFSGVYVFNEGIGAFNHYMKYDEIYLPDSFETVVVLYYSAYGQPWWSSRDVYSKERRLVLKNSGGHNLVVL